MRNMLSPRQWVVAAVMTTLVGGGGIAAATGALEALWHKIQNGYHAAQGMIGDLIAYFSSGWETAILPVLGVFGVLLLVILFITDA